MMSADMRTMPSKRQKETEIVWWKYDKYISLVWLWLIGLSWLISQAVFKSFKTYY
jgi:hypothetical protein